jgi:DNA-binding transcriptional LysR family regulator
MTKRLNLRLLEVFRAVVAANGATEAAVRLNVTQPAISKAIAQLELELGLQLFGREHGRLHPTADAERLYAETERLFDQVSTFHDRITRIAGARDGRLTVAAIPTLAASVVAHAAARFAKQRPDVKIEIVVESAASVAEAVAHHRCDLGLVHSPVADKTLKAEIVGESEIVAVLSKNHTLARQKEISPEDLSGEKLILNDTGSPPTHLVYETFAAARVDFDVALQANSSAVGNAVARAGFGIALIDPWANHPSPGTGLALRRFRPRVPLRIALLHSALRPPSRLDAAFRSDLLGVLRQAARRSPFVRVL